MVLTVMGRNRVQYGARGFAQDAANAMRGDIVRGLIELITNSDDAYEGETDGKILIEVEHRRGTPWNVIVRDRARGMKKDVLKASIGQIGSRTSGFEEGRDVRGNLGRGAKDVAAFGDTTFESICDGGYAKLVLESDGTFDDPTSRRTTDDDRSRLGIPRGNGTVVTVAVDPRFRCPLHPTLIDRLSKHFQLRDINSDSRREVVLVDLNSGTRSPIRFQKPLVEELLSVDVEVPGFEGALATVEIQRLPERGEGSGIDTERDEGLLVKGKRAIYENTLFKFEGTPAAHWFTGSVRCPFIDELARSYDDRADRGDAHEASNPMPIISRSRDGLEHAHPFYAAVAAAIEDLLTPLVEEEERRARDERVHESARLRRDLDSLGRDLGQLLDSDLREIDDEGLDGGGGSGSDPDIYLIPAKPVLYMNENKTVSVIVKRSVGVSVVAADLDPEGVVERIDAEDIPLEPHPRRDEYLIGRIRLRPLIENEETALTLHAGEVELEAVLEVRPEREIHDPDPPESLEFERDRYHLTEGRRRWLILRAPLDVINDAGSSVVRVSAAGPGVAVLGGPVTLNFDEEQLCFIGKVEVEPRTLGTTTVLTATLGVCVAECQVVVGRHDEEGPKIKIELLDDEYGAFRAIVEREGQSMTIKILGGHKALKRYLGPGPEFPHQDRAAARTVMAEIIAGEAARLVVERKYQAAGELDGPAFYAEHLQYLAKYLRRCHLMMLHEVPSD